MRRWTRILEQVLTAYATVAVTRWLSRSPSFLRLTERVLHEWDHLPHRWQGKPVPPFEPMTSDSKIDYEEKHDEPSPYPLSDNQPQASSGFAKRRTETHRAPPPPKSESDRVAEQIREIQEKLRRR
ncbi:uncharacterized protein MRET_1333 [Malassezia restricta]|uniref:uncharacterized protein n=1 Tax=Malassezia restricta TaxID=76775 RepID=UPI000DD157E6|nr:uncharacterized protein MRET_1333 [Malassezia restricta]AXA49166.1 uncharacterized protein MRET_1333 [Malassezia restricta]